MKLSDEQFEFLLDVIVLMDWCILEYNIKITGGELYRTQNQQNIYYEKGLSKKKHSYHQDRLAIDLNFFKDGKLLRKKSEIKFIGDYWESLNEKNRWGGNYKNFYDGCHFERAVWKKSSKNVEIIG